VSAPTIKSKSDITSLAAEMRSLYSEIQILRTTETMRAVDQDQIEMEARARAIALEINAHRGLWPFQGKDEATSMSRDADKLYAYEVIRVLSVLGERVDKFEEVPMEEAAEDDPRHFLPENFKGRRSTPFAEGWAKAQEIFSRGISIDDKRRNIECPYPPQTFRGTEFFGGWNEFNRSTQKSY